MPATRSPLVVLLLLVVVLIAYGQRNQPNPMLAPDRAPQVGVDAQVQAALPAGARITHAIPRADGSIALAWQVGGGARTGLASPTSSGRYRLWLATTPGRADVAGATSVTLIKLPGLQEDVLVSSYRTDDCCAWVNLFALTSPPRLLFASPTSNTRLLAGRLVIQWQLPGEYPGMAAPVDTDVYSWNGKAFSPSGNTLAPQHYFPLASRMRWSYRAPGQVIDRWVQESRPVGHQVETVVRSAAKGNQSVTGLPDVLYVMGTEGEVWQQSPVPWQVLGPSPGEGSTWEASGALTARVETASARVTVPAGTFQNVLVVVQGAERFYYAPHVGLIREDRGGAPVLELLSYTGG